MRGSYHGVASNSTGSDEDEGIRGDIGYDSRGSAGKIFSKSRFSFQRWRKPPMSDRGARQIYLRYTSCALMKRQGTIATVLGGFLYDSGRLKVSKIHLVHLHTRKGVRPSSIMEQPGS